MPKTLTEVAEEAAGLTLPDQLKLARILLENADPSSEFQPEVQAAWDAEIDRRLEELRSGQVKGVPLDEVKKRIGMA